jgi:hypothetical protein
MSTHPSTVPVPVSGARNAPARGVGPTFGASAPLKDLQRRFGFTPEAVAERAREQAAGAGGA